ncbi:hypothetical protein HAX54_004595 [Datura stramonium]|uniref:Uncharacterized protein n=1 Tax=Datura stramonium TaxID=4076 RepID=A0ABS8T8U1_DATST|nr:hypothetical protein [Datura stramonium]
MASSSTSRSEPHASTQGEPMPSPGMGSLLEKLMFQGRTHLFLCALPKVFEAHRIPLSIGKVGSQMDMFDKKTLEECELVQTVLG